VFCVAGGAHTLDVSESQEIVLQSFQCIALLVEVVPQIVGLLEYVLTVVDHTLADKRRHLESSQRRSPGSAQVMRHKSLDAMREKGVEEPFNSAFRSGGKSRLEVTGIRRLLP